MPKKRTSERRHRQLNIFIFHPPKNPPPSAPMRCLALMLPFAAALAFSAEAEPSARPVDDLSQAAVQSAFQVLRNEYIRRDDLSFDELNRAALQGLLSRLDLGAELIRRDEKVAQPVSGLHSELLTPDIAYIRPQAFAEGEVTQMEMALKQFGEQKVKWLVMDLRAPSAPGSFDVAAAMLDFFVPRGEVIFKMKQMGRDDAELTLSKTDVLWEAPVVLLIDGETGNVGEAIAAVLHQRGRAFLVGSPTRGATVRYESVTIDDHWSLRFARSELLLADGKSLFKKGLKPEFPMELEAETKQSIFKDTFGGSIKPHVFDKARLRYNEAALVARKHPELDAYIRRSAGETMAGDDMPERDTVIQRAVDMLESSQFLRASKLKWDKSSSSRTNKSR